MKSLVFTINKKKRSPMKSTFGSVKYISKRYGSILIFSLFLIFGLTIGSLMCNKIDGETLSRLDFFFLSNIDNRLKNGAMGAFSASFASNFIFLLSSFLMGFSLWGIIIIPIIVSFKGFGIGVSAGYLFMNFGFKGIFFYLIVLIPGIFLFCLAIIFQSASSYTSFKMLWNCLLASDKYKFKDFSKVHLLKSFRYLLLTVFSAVLDMVLWVLFAGLFNFS